MAQAKLEVKSELNKIVEQLQKIATASGEVSSELKRAGVDVGESLEKEVKKVETFFGKLNSVGRRVADQLRGDFKSLASINALSGALKLSSQFSGSVKETIALSDAIRKLGASFGIAEKDFSSLQADLTKGMGEIGMSSEEAGETIKGLAGTGVQGKEPLKAYSMKSAQLASLGGEKGQGGNIAGMLAGVVRAQGKNVNDPKAMEAVASAVSKAMEGTGKSATDLLSHMQATFESMTTEQRKKTTASGLSSLAIAETVAGPQASAAIQKYLSMSKAEKAGLDAQGFKKIFTKEGGIDVKGLKEFAKEMKQRGLDMRGSAQTFGFSPEEAEGLVRLTESADTLDAALQRTAKASDDLNKKTKKNMGMTEAFQANVNRLKGIVGGPMATATQGITDLLSSASESNTGASAVVAGGATLAALLAGGALKGISGGMGGFMKEATVGQAKKQALQALTGEKIQDVNVVNASEIGEAINGGGGLLGGAAQAGAGGLLGKMGGMAGMAKGGLGIAGAGAAGYAVGSAINEIPGVSDAIVSGFEKVAGLFGKGPMSEAEISKRGAQMIHKVTVESRDPRLKVTKHASRGSSSAPTR